MTRATVFFTFLINTLFKMEEISNFFKSVRRIFAKFINEYTLINEYRGQILKNIKRVQRKKCEYLGKKVMKTKRVHSFNLRSY